MSHLETLNLGNCGIGDRGALALAQSDQLTRLRKLGLWTSREGSPLANSISEETAGLLRERLGDCVHF